MSKEGVLPISLILKKSERSDSTLQYSAVPCSIFCGSLFSVTCSSVKMLKFLPRSAQSFLQPEVALIYCCNIGVILLVSSFFPFNHGHWRVNQADGVPHVTLGALPLKVIRHKTALGTLETEIGHI